MPHIIVESAKANNFTSEESADLLSSLNQALSTVDSINLDAIKSRLIPLDHYCKGENNTTGQFLHITCAVLDGRSEDILSQARDVLLEKTREKLSAWRKDIPITLEIREMDGRFYFKG